MASTRVSSLGRRQLLRLGTTVALGAGAVSLGGCGFALRQAPKFAFTSLRVSGAMGGVARSLQRELGSTGLQIVTAARPAGDTAAPQVVLNVLIDRRERVVVGKLANGQVRELELRYRFRFNLTTPSGRVLLEEDEVLIERDLSFSEEAVLAKVAEEQAIFNDMQGDVVQQVMRRLASVKSV